MSNSLIFHSSTKSELKNLIAETVKTELNSFFSKDSDPNKLFSRKEVAQILGISLPTLNNWTKNGIIAAVRINSSVRYRSIDVESALQSVKSIKYLRNKI